MAIVTDWEVIDTSYGPMRMYTARPEGGTAGPGVLLVHDSFGVTDEIQAVSRKFAEEGIVALAPDLYHRLPAHTVSYDDIAAAQALRAQLSADEIFDDLTAALRFLGARGEVRSGLCGAVGYGAGGCDATVLASRNWDVLALALYSAPIASGDPSAPINGCDDLQAPALLFFGDSDSTIPPGEIEVVGETLESLGKDHEIVVYPDAANGFFCESRPGEFDPDAAADAWTRTVDFLYQYLEG